MALRLVNPEPWGLVKSLLRPHTLGTPFAAGQLAEPALIAVRHSLVAVAVRCWVASADAAAIPAPAGPGGLLRLGSLEGRPVTGQRWHYL